MDRHHSYDDYIGSRVIVSLRQALKCWVALGAPLVLRNAY